jgi:hypothetical protein
MTDPTIIAIIMIIIPFEFDMSFYHTVRKYFLTVPYTYPMGGVASKGGTKTGTKLVDDVPGIKPDGTIVFAKSTPEESAALLKQIKEIHPNAFVLQKGAKTIVSTEGMSTAAKTNLQNMAKQYNATSLVDGGKLVAKGVTWQRVGLVAGGVVVAVILIDPESGAVLGDTLATFGSSFAAPLIPSLVSSAVPVSVSLSMLLALMFMSKQM